MIFAALPLRLSAASDEAARGQDKQGRSRKYHPSGASPQTRAAEGKITSVFSQALPGSPLLRAMNARDLGLRLLDLSDLSEVQAGLASLTKSVEQGDAEAQVALGRIHLRGIMGVPKDAGRAHAWFERAAAAHHPSAAYYLGVMSRNGEGAPADPAAAARWFETAAQEGSPHAMFLLANAYRAGAGYPGGHVHLSGLR